MTETYASIESSHDEKLGNYLSEFYPNRSFTEEQKNAIGAIDGKYLLYAVPGSGKTTVLIARAGYMMYCGMSASSMVNVTFLREAAKHMREEYVAQFGNRLGMGEIPEFCTLHSLAKKVLKEYEKHTGIPVPEFLREGVRLPSETEIMHDLLEEEGERTQMFNPVGVVLGIMKSMPNPPKGDWRLYASKVVAMISYVKNKMMSEEDIQRLGTVDTEAGPICLWPYYIQYQKYLEAHHVMDYDDMLLRALQVLRKNEFLREKFRGKYTSISVDEVQDTSMLQHRIIREMVGEETSLFMVGDDDQSIYLFRGAEPRMMLKFKELYPDGEELTMGTNFRSSQHIVQAADKVIQKNAIRRCKNVRASHQDAGAVTYVDLTDSDKISYFVEQARSAINGNLKLGILYRNNAQGLLPLAVFAKENIKFYCPKVGDITQTLNSAAPREICDMLAFTQEPNSEQIYSRIWYCFNGYPGLFLKKERMLEFREYYKKHKGDRVLDALSNFLRDINDWGKATAVSRLNTELEQVKNRSPFEVLTRVLAWGYLTSPSIEGNGEAKTLIEIMHTIATRCKTVEEYLKLINDLRQPVSVAAVLEQDDDSAHVFLSTIHSAKGQEYDKVILDGMEETIIPGINNARQYSDIWYGNSPEKKKRCKIEEERRLFYVACTRAKTDLVVLVKQYQKEYPDRIASRFVNELYWANKDIVAFFNYCSPRDAEKALRAAREKAEAAEKAEREAARKTMDRKILLEQLPTQMVDIPGQGFKLCKYAVTQALWEVVMGTNPSSFKGRNRPVEKVSWNDCRDFIQKLNEMPEVKSSGFVYRMPTGREWEDACRAGSSGSYCRLADGMEITKETLGRVAWYDDNSGSETHPVGQKDPNAFGLYDMHGNVWEWTADDDGGLRVNRGGSWLDDAEGCAADARFKDGPDGCDNLLGFRLAAETTIHFCGEKDQQAFSEKSSHHLPSLLDNDYQILGVSASASDQEVKKAYRQLATRHHSDKFAYQGQPAQQQVPMNFQAIQAAYERICNERQME